MAFSDKTGKPVKKRANLGVNGKPYEPLSREEEIALAKAWRENGDVAARNRLVDAHEGFAISRARKRAQGRSDIQDMEQEAKLGLLAAADRFDPDLGWRFATYATWWIMSALQSHKVKSHSLVHVNHGIYRKMFFSLNRTMEQVRTNLAKSGGTSPSEAEVRSEAARKLGVTVRDIEKFERLIVAGDFSLNSPVRRNDEEGQPDDFIDRLASDSLTAEEVYEQNESERLMRDAVQRSMEGLNAREREVIMSRKLNPGKGVTLADLSEKYGVTRERVRQIEVRAMQKMQKFIKREGFNAKSFGMKE